MVRRFTIGGLIVLALIPVTHRAAYGSWNVPTTVGYCDKLDGG